jgi:hypothetical protein
VYLPEGKLYAKSGIFVYSGLKLDPHPQVVTAVGFLILKVAPYWSYL